MLFFFMIVVGIPVLGGIGMAASKGGCRTRKR